MGASFYREWKLKFSDMRLYAVIILLVFAGGLGIQYFLHDFHGDKGYLPLGTLMAAFRKNPVVRKTIFIFPMAIWLCTSSDWCGNEFGDFDM